MAKVSFVTRSGEEISFNTRKRGKKSKRSLNESCSGCGGPSFQFARGPMLERPKGLRKGQIVKVGRKLYMVMKDGLKPIKLMV